MMVLNCEAPPSYDTFHFQNSLVMHMHVGLPI